MPWAIPPETKYSHKRGSEGIVVWGIQRALKDTGYLGILEDGDYGGRTESKVEDFQTREGLTVDGVFGPQCSRRMARRLEETVDVPLPERLIEGFVEGESGGHIGAVNHSVAGGVDCSYLQRRVLDGASDATIERAFDGQYQFQLLARTLKGRHDAFYGREGAKTHEKAWRLAALHHNYPLAADNLSRGVWPNPYSTSEQQWVINIGATFADGQYVRTPLEWCRYYALGSTRHQHPGHVTKFVSDWTP